MFRSQRLSYKYALVSYMLFGIQGLMATVGAIELVFPDIVFPIPYPSGRAFHLNLSLYWPLIGMAGAVYYFFSQEAEREIYSLKIININFWLLSGGVGSILGSLLLGFTEGREYLEAVWPLKIALAAALLLAGFNLSRTYLASAVPKDRATLVSMLTGSLTLIIFYLPNIVSPAHPSVDELAKFLVAHLWEEMSLELIGTGVLAALLIKMAGTNRRAAETAIYLDITFVALVGILATGHHYYWIGVPGIWLWIGGIFSAMQVLPVFILLYASLKSLKFNSFISLPDRDKIALILVGCSMFYHIFGAGFLGLFMAYPPINRFIHGTYITSAHSHLALFGVFGFLALAVCFHILFAQLPLAAKIYQRCWLAIIVLNIGLLTMGISLLLAGGLQAYFWRVIGLGVGQTNQLIRPYLFIRMLGGVLYSAGSMLLAFMVVKAIWPNIGAVLFNAEKLAGMKPMDDLHKTQRLLQDLIEKGKQTEYLLLKIKNISDKLHIWKKFN